MATMIGVGDDLLWLVAVLLTLALGLAGALLAATRSQSAGIRPHPGGARASGPQVRRNR